MNSFRTIEASGPVSDLESLQFATVKSPALGARADITFFCASQARDLKEVPLVILLHGVYGSHWAWALKGGAHRTLQCLVDRGEVPPMALVMPSDGLWGDGSGYVPHTHQDFEKWIVEEVPVAAMNILPNVKPRSPLCIAGLSMGGFGALRLAAKYPGRFKAVSGHSAITHFDQLKMFVEDDMSGCGVDPENHCVFETMLRHKDALPPIRFDCGSEDQLLEHNRELHRRMDVAGISHCYEEFPGGHTWDYWATHIADTFRFFGKVLSQ